ncbi:TetR/AcrR family transcriptional regulator [Actinomadura rugatobispora]|uniref:TetR/AcrR family transcriptional regulator n=1 Tax=Actinomadura rugatobispora TaxID=1994 RepID=A0ABW0ZV26_9ACTN|nr:TetR/AcrR family transcriptional regulator [Actinomadura rugatobispora]
MAGGEEPGTTGPATPDEAARDQDLTARARIRDAALDQFATHGVRGTTIRGVAAAAGVSPGLVQHHFGSKEKLREACDEYAMEALRTTKQESLKGGMGDPGFIALAMQTGLPIQRYLARALVDGSPGAAQLFDEAVAVTKAMFEDPGLGLSKPRTSDLHAYSAAMVAMTFGSIVLHEHLSRALGANTLTMEGYPRLGMAMMDVYTDNVVDDDLVQKGKAALAEMRDRHSTGNGASGDGDA